MEIYDQFIKTKLQEYLLSSNAEESEKRGPRATFWASEAEKPVFDLYHAWIGTEPTNPIDATKLIMFSAAKMMELALVERLQKMGLAKEGDQQRFQIEREGIQISGYTDCIFVDGSPCEIKTFYGDYQARELEAGKPKTSYLKQLAIYMDALNQDKGKLIYLDRGTGSMYEFTLTREGDTFKCLSIEFNLTDVYKKWARLYKNNILPRKEPDAFIEVGAYKAPIESINWQKLSKSEISAARGGYKVIGEDRENHWKILYSPYKNLWIERQGASLGYSDAELAKIRELTKGYSTKK